MDTAPDSALPESRPAPSTPSGTEPADGMVALPINKAFCTDGAFVSLYGPLRHPMGSGYRKAAIDGLVLHNLIIPREVAELSSMSSASRRYFVPLQEGIVVQIGGLGLHARLVIADNVVDYIKSRRGRVIYESVLMIFYGLLSVISIFGMKSGAKAIVDGLMALDSLRTTPDPAAILRDIDREERSRPSPLSRDNDLVTPEPGPSRSIP
ncbi:MAG: hypothetical protein NXI16_16745 [Alphaproteobacteria bacterium]|nr:hypothetical protein [Alphaproteobacteria bacterium]